MTTRRWHRVLPATALMAAIAGSGPAPVASSAEADDPVLLAAGDIAACASPGDESTAALLAASPTAAVATLGDNAYPDGTLAQFTSCYEPTWGQHRSRTRPSAGNHDYRTANAAGYFAYFGSAAGEPGKGYYSYDLGTWRVLVLNSNCSKVGGCAAGSPQEQWLRAELAANPRDCTLAYWHHARFSSGASGNTASVEPLWTALYESGADLVLSAHSHLYERFAPQTPTGQSDARGITQFVVGTGGKGLESFGTTQPNSLVRNNSTFGVLSLTLQTGGYAWQFKPVAGGAFTDAGSAVCVTGTRPPPPPPTGNLLTNAGFETDANGDSRPDGWTSSAKFTRSAAITPKEGEYTGRHQANDATKTRYTISQAVDGLSAGSVFDVSGWVNIPQTTDAFTFEVAVAWRTATNSVIRLDTVKVYSSSTNGAWDQAVTTLTAPGGTENAQVRMKASGLSATVYVDDFSLIARP